MGALIGVLLAWAILIGLFWYGYKLLVKDECQPAALGVEVKREMLIAQCVQDYRAIYEVRGYSSAPLEKCERVADGEAVL
jgi:hypothetical protein